MLGVLSLLPMYVGLLVHSAAPSCGVIARYLFPCDFPSSGLHARQSLIRLSLSSPHITTRQALARCFFIVGAKHRIVTHFPPTSSLLHHLVVSWHRGIAPAKLCALPLHSIFCLILLFFYSSLLVTTFPAPTPFLHIFCPTP